MPSASLPEVRIRVLAPVSTSTDPPCAASPPLDDEQMATEQLPAFPPEPPMLAA